MTSHKELKIGVFVVAVITASFFLINYLRGEDIFNREIELSSRYPSVEGLVASAPVYIKGYKAGKVSEVVYDKSSDDFNVICSVSREFDIPSDSRMVIYSVDIMGGKGIRIDYGTSDTYAEDGGMLAPAYEAGLIDGLAGGIAPLMGKATEVLDSLNVTVAGMNKLLSDTNLASISRTLVHVEKIMADVNGISKEIDGRSDELTALIDNLSALSGTLVTVASKADTAMNGVSSVVDQLSQSDIEGLLNSIRSLVDKISDPEGTIGKMFTDDSVYDSLDSLLSDVDSLINKIQENPKKYLRISVF